MNRSFLKRQIESSPNYARCFYLAFIATILPQTAILKSIKAFFNQFSAQFKRSRSRKLFEVELDCYSNRCIAKKRERFFIFMAARQLYLGKINTNVNNNKQKIFR